MDAAFPSMRAVPRRGASLSLTPLRLTMALLALAVAMRAAGLWQRPLWLDEAYSAWFSSRSWHVLWTAVPGYEPHPPFYYSLLKLWRGLFGGDPIGLRSLSLLLGVAVVPLIVSASAELERLRPSGRPLMRSAIAGFLVACSPTLISQAQEARPYPLLTFAYALAILGLLRLFREFRDGPGGWPSWLMLTAGTELGLWAHGLGLLYGASLGLALLPAWLKPRIDRARLLRGLAAGLAVAFLYLPCLLMIARRSGDWGHGWLVWTPVMMLQLLSLYSVPVEVLTIGSAVAALVMILLAKRAIQFAVQRPGWNPDRAILLLWWAPPIAAIAVSQLFMPIFLARTLGATLIAAYLALSGAIARIESRQERLLLTAALVVTLIPAALQMAVRPATEQWDEVAAYLNRNVHSGDQLWVYPNDSALALRAAGAKVPLRGIPGDYPAVGFKGPIRAGSPAVVSVTPEQARRLTGDAALARSPVIWLVTRQSNVFDPDEDLPRALARTRRAGTAESWAYIAVRPYYRR